MSKSQEIAVYLGISGLQYRLGRDIIVATRPWDSTEIQWLLATPEDHKFTVECYDKQYVPGQVFRVGGKEFTLARPGAIPAAGCMEVELVGVGNPDHRQFSNVAPKTVCRGTSIEELQKSTKDFINVHELGYGNFPCAPVWQWADKGGGRAGRKKIGFISYNGKYRTVAEKKKEDAESKARWEAESNKKD